MEGEIYRGMEKHNEHGYDKSPKIDDVVFGKIIFLKKESAKEKIKSSSDQNDKDAGS